MERERLKIIYIASLGHSGSTLLDLLISGHPDVVSIGEAKNLNPRTSPTIDCACPAKRLRDCPFWKRVDARLQRRASLRFRDLDLASADAATFLAHNVAFFGAVSELTGRRIIVDSSKSSSRLARLLAAGRFDVDPIRLVRRPHGVVYSNVKKGRDWLSWSRKYAKHARRTRSLLRGVRHSVVRYEELAEDPEAVISALMPRLGLSFDPRQLDWSGRERHDCGGNRMRRSPSSEVRIDREWERAMSSWQKAVVSLLTVRARG